MLELLGEGESKDRIGERLFLSPNTVRNHIQNILRKLNLPNRTEAAVFAVREGLMDEPADGGPPAERR